MTETDTPNASEILANELAIEQAHVDKVYDHLETATASARNVEAESRAKFQTDRADWMREEDGTALFERDASPSRPPNGWRSWTPSMRAWSSDDSTSTPQRRATSAASACATTTTNRW